MTNVLSVGIGLRIKGKENVLIVVKGTVKGEMNMIDKVKTYGIVSGIILFFLLPIALVWYWVWKGFQIVYIAPTIGIMVASIFYLVVGVLVALGVTIVCLIFLGSILEWL